MYIPKGQILDTYYYTGGNEYQTPNRNIYIGYYHKDTSNRIWSGKEHNSITNKYSFPSGHTFNATIISLVMLNKFPNEFIFNILAVLIGLSRIFLGVHYPTDIISGIIFGYLIYNLIN